MRGLFCGSKAKNNEEYKKVIKVKMNIMIFLLLIGIFTIGGILIAKYKLNITIEDYILGVYTGAGTGLIFASVIMWVRFKRLLGNEGKLKEDRLRNTDERIGEISSKAFRIAAGVLLVAMYLIGFIGAFKYPILVRVLVVEVGIFLVTYVIGYKIYEKKM